MKPTEPTEPIELSELTKADIDNVFILSIDHDTWNNKILILRELEPLGTSFWESPSFEGINHIENNSYIAQKGSFTLIGPIEDYPEYYL